MTQNMTNIIRYLFLYFSLFVLTLSLNPARTILFQNGLIYYSFYLIGFWLPVPLIICTIKKLFLRNSTFVRDLFNYIIIISFFVFGFSILMKLFPMNNIKSIQTKNNNTSYLSPIETPESGMWYSSSDGFSAFFPDEPQKVDASTNSYTGYAYQCVQNYSNSGILYSVNVVSLSPVVGINTEKDCLKSCNESFIRSMGESPQNAIISWSTFADGRIRLIYNFNFSYQGLSFIGRGFWILDNSRAIRVSVSYTQNLSDSGIEQALYFLDSFVLLSK